MAATNENLSEATIRGWDQEYLEKTLEGSRADYTSEQLVWVFDELIQRKVDIDRFTLKLNDLLRDLDDETVSSIEVEAKRYSRRVIHHSINEKLERGLEPLSWYYGSNGNELGPFNRNQMFELARQGHLRPTDFVWREGWDDWYEPKDVMPGIFDRMAGPPPGSGQTGGYTPPRGGAGFNPPPNQGYQQQQQQQQSAYRGAAYQKPGGPGYNPPPPGSSYAPPQSAYQYAAPAAQAPKPSVPGGLVVAGVIQFLCVPYWWATAFFQLFNRGRYLGEETQMMAALLCVIMGILSIPMGIGLVTGKRWSYFMGFILLILALFYLFYMMLGADFWQMYWIIFIALEMSVLGLILAHTRRFRE